MHGRARDVVARPSDPRAEPPGSACSPARLLPDSLAHHDADRVWPPFVPGDSSPDEFSILEPVDRVRPDLNTLVDLAGVRTRLEDNAVACNSGDALRDRLPLWKGEHPTSRVGGRIELVGH